MEETWRFQQEAIVAAVETGAAQKVLDLPLPELGPYSLAFSRSGRHALLGGNKGHLAVMEWQKAHLTSEIQVSSGAGWGACSMVLTSRGSSTAASTSCTQH